MNASGAHDHGGGGESTVSATPQHRGIAARSRRIAVKR